MNMEPIKDAAERFGMGRIRLGRLCREGRIPGAELRIAPPPGDWRNWYIPVTVTREHIKPAGRRPRRY